MSKEQDLMELAKDRRSVNFLRKNGMRGDMATKAFNGEGLINDEHKQEVDITDVCSRHKNDFIVSDDKLLPLITSIRKSGVAQPPLLVNIANQISHLEQHLQEDDIKDKEEIIDNLEYLKEQLNRGKKYAIVSGHRRFKACKYLFVESNNQFLKDKGYEGDINDIEKTYDFLKEKYDVLKQDFRFEFKETNGFDTTYLKLPAVIKDLDDVKEKDLYIDTNLTQREISAFEIITKVKDIIDEKMNGEDREEFVKHYLGKDCNVARVNKGDLYKAYIKEELGIENLTRSNIFKALKVIENAQTPKLFEMILDGRIAVRDAEVLSRKENLDKQIECLDRIANGLPMFEGADEVIEEDDPEAAILKSVISIRKQIKELEKQMDKIEYSDSRKDQSKRSNRERLLKKLNAINIDEFIKKI